MKDDLEVVEASHGSRSLGGGGSARALVLMATGFILVGVYKTAIVPLFAYSGLVWEDWHLGRLLLATTAMGLASLVLPHQIAKPAQFIVGALFILVLVPVSTIPLVSGILEPNHATALSLAASLCFAVLSFAARKNVDALAPKSVLSEGFFISVSVIVSVCVLLVIYVMAGFSIERPDFSEANDVRLEFRDTLASSSPILAYAVPLSVKVLNPLLLIVGLQWKKWWVVGLSLVGQLSIFTLNGQRSILIGTIGALFVYFAVSRWRRIRTSRFFLGAALFIVISWVIFAVLGSATLMSLFVRRLIVVPGMLTGVYHSYYDESNFAQFRHSRIFSFGDPEPAPPRVVGEYFTGNPDIAANANFLADGYANFGWVGVVVFGLVLALILAFLNRVAAGVPNQVVFALLVGPTFALSDTALFTTLLTHGLIALMVILAIYPRPRGASASQGGIEVTPRDNSGP